MYSPFAPEMTTILVGSVFVDHLRAAGARSSGSDHAKRLVLLVVYDREGLFGGSAYRQARLSSRRHDQDSEHFVFRRIDLTNLSPDFSNA